MRKVIICMPEYNGGDVLFDFVADIKEQLLDVNFVIVDDNSSHKFKDQIINKYNHRQDINLVFNEKPWSRNVHLKSVTGSHKT
jgi:glycosyltransferase involved in cell wall biosynthesis